MRDEFNGAVRFVIRDLENFQFSIEITVLFFLKKLNFFSGFTRKVSTFLRLESRRIDETAPTASSALVSSESSPPSALKPSSPASPCVGGEGQAFCAEGLQTEIRRTFRESSEAFLEEPLTPAAEDE